MVSIVEQAQRGNPEAFDALWVESVDTIRKAASQVARRSSHNITEDDLASEVTLEFPKLLRRFDPTKSQWDKYIYYAAYRTALDRVRASDPLGLSHPVVRKGRKEYPGWCSVGEFSPEQLEEGMRNLDAAQDATGKPK